MDEQEYRERMRGRLAEYLRLRAEVGDERARETLLERYTELQAQRMGPLLDGGLAEGFGKVTAAFAAMGDEQAREELMDGYAERQYACMAPYLEDSTLTQAIAAVLPVFEELGLQEEVVDCSTSEHESAVVVTRTCLCKAAAEDLGGVSDPPSLHCELSAEATMRAFPDTDVEVVLRQVRGAYACGLRYTRPAPGSGAA